MTRVSANQARAMRVYCIRGLSVVWANSVRGYETLDAKKKLQHGAANKP